MLDREELKRLHDLNYLANQNTRERGADDRLFSWVTQWDDALLQGTQMEYRGEFNIIRKAQRQIISDLRANPVQVDFIPLDDAREDGAEILDGLYLNDDRRNSSLESYDNASLEAVDCGVGGWELFNEYETNNAGDKKQVIRRKPIYEANNNSFPDANAKRLDKSDAMNWSILEPYTEEGYKRLYKELTGNETNAAPANFGTPEQSYVFPWVSGRNKIYYIVRFYHKTLVKDKVLTFQDPLGQLMKLRESDLTRTIDDEEVKIMDELIDAGYSIIEERVIKRWQVKRYIASGEEILKVEDVPGDKIPVVHTYGERTFVEGEEIWEGVVRLAKDPQRLRNFMLSYLASIVSRSPREKPIFAPEQIAGFEFMYEENGADNNYPYYLQKLKDASGEPLPIGPIATMPAAQIPPGMAELSIETREAVKDVADPGLPNDIADPDLSGYAIEQLQARFDQQSIVYQQNMKFAKRWDAEIYASMASTVYDSPRKVTITTPDGERKQVEIMQTIMDEESGELITINDLTNAEFEVYAEIGQSYTSKKEKTRDELGMLAEQFKDVDSNMVLALNFKRLLLMDGVDLQDVKDYSKKQLLISGIRKPETEEEVAFLEQMAQQQEQPDPDMIYALAEQGKAQAQQMREQRLAMLDQANVQNDTAKLDIDAFEAQTDRQKVQIEAAEAGVKINLDKAKISNTNADTMRKLTEPFRSRANA